MHSGLGGLGENTDRCSEPIVLFSGLWPLGISSGIGSCLVFSQRDGISWYVLSPHAFLTINLKS